MNVSLVLAIATDGTIGDKGTMPWKLPSDLERFKKITDGGTVVMGRKTWDSLPEKFRPLPNRQNIVLTRSVGEDIMAQGGIPVTSMQHALSVAGRDTFIIGGVEIYKLFVPVAERAYITRVYGMFEGDTHLDKGELFPSGEWELANELGLPNTDRARHSYKDTHDSDFHVWRRA